MQIISLLTVAKRRLIHNNLQDISMWFESTVTRHLKQMSTTDTMTRYHQRPVVQYHAPVREQWHVRYIHLLVWQYCVSVLQLAQVPSVYLNERTWYQAGKLSPPSRPQLCEQDLMDIEQSEFSNTKSIKDIWLYHC